MLIDDSRGPEPQCRAATRRSPTCLSGRRVAGKEGRNVKVAKWNDNETSCACICVTCTCSLSNIPDGDPLKCNTKTQTSLLH